MYKVCVCVCMCVCVSQLKELWLESVTDATESKIKEECAPGRPMSIFSDKPHKVTNKCYLEF